MIISLTVLSALFGCNMAEKEAVIVPKGYKGYIVVIFNQKNGTARITQDGKRIYEIPSNGILKTQLKANYGVREFTEFYFDKISTENKLPSYAQLDKIPLDTIVGFIGTNGNANN